MSRVLAWLLLGTGAAMYLALVLHGELLPPPPAVTAVLCLTGLRALVSRLGRGIKARLREEREIAQVVEAGVEEAVGRRVLGEYVPYVVEAARELGAQPHPAAASLLRLALERLLASRPAGWREMAGGLAEALAAQGDLRALSLLYRVQQAAGTEEVGGLAGSITLLEGRAHLLRSAEPDTTRETLLRSVSGHTPAERQEALLRPVNANGDSETVGEGRQ